MLDPFGQTPEDVVKRFIEAMHNWESDAYQRYKASLFDETDHAKIIEASDSAYEERRQVVARYCTPKERHPAAFGYPPEYDPARETITEIRQKTKTRVEVLTRYVYPEQYIDEQRRYKVVQTPDGWRIDDRTILSDDRWYSLL